MAVSLKASKQGLLLVDEARKKRGWKKADPEWCEAAEVAPASLKRFWLARRPIRRESFIAICRAVEVNWELVADAVPPEAKITATRGFQPAIIDWRSVASEMLSERKRLTTNPLTAADGRTFDLDDIYVPVGLVARSQRARLGEDVPPSEGSRLYHLEGEKGVLHTGHLEFLLTESQGWRLAIIGEPGTGKTTLLQKIAFWLLASTSSDIPIWINLADLQGKSLEAYLLEDWLKTATRKVRVTEELQDSLGELFNSGRVWLLLDGLDEMVTDGTGPLGAIGPQFTGWIASARILLTCRLNIWDGGKNPLEEFETYRTLDFSYGDRGTPDRIGQFIERWFHSQPELGDSLRRELDQPGHRELRDLVKNPLRLTLLCRTWGRWNGKLPGSKAELYQQFAEALYDWKQEIFPTTSDLRQELNEALGRLASRALTEEKIKYRFRHRLVREVLGEPDALLYKLALTLGWLNVVGIAAENPDELVYAFWHPVFQEYFADIDSVNTDIFQKLESSEADDLSMLLNRNEWLEDRDTRITSSMESVLSWRERLEKIFDETWQTVAEVIDTIGTSKPSLAFASGGVFRSRNSNNLAESSIPELIRLLSISKDKLTKLQMIELLGRNAHGNQDAIACLQDLLNNSDDKDLRREAAVSLGEIDPGNEQAGVKRAKMINLEPLHKVALAITLMPGSDRNNMQIYLLVNAVSSEFLPPHLEMSVLDENGEKFDEMTSRTEDYAMQLDFAGEEGDRFTLNLALGDACFTEKFVI